MSDEETTPTEDSGDAFASDAETVLEAAPAATDAASASEPTGNDAFSDANNDGGDEADGSAQGVSQAHQKNMANLACQRVSLRMPRV